MSGLNNNVLGGLVTNKSYAKKVLPHIKREYFSTHEESYLFELVKKYIIKYRSMPTITSLKIELAQQTDLVEKDHDNISQLIDTAFSVPFDYTVDWLIDRTEDWCKKQALFNAIQKSVDLMEIEKNLESIPEMIRQALAVEFDKNVGQELFNDEDIATRWERYHEVVKKYGFGIDVLDRVTSGGMEPKTLNVIAAATNVGKSMAMISIAANMIRQGHDVLYLTLEMSEEKILQRFEANFLDIPINDVTLMSKDKYVSKLNVEREKGRGRLMVKEFPPATINTNHVRSLLEELEIKKGFKPVVIIVDYLNLMTSCRYSGESLYVVVKSIAEELRGLAVEKEYCILSATQGNRATNNSKNSTFEIDNVSESIGLPQTVDLLLAAISPEELRERGIQMWIALKNRYSGIVNYKFPLQTEFEKARLLDSEEDVSFVGSENIEKVKDEEIRQKKSKLKLKATQDDFNPMDELFG